ncbi:phosphorylase family protein [Stratiformator vulcanicus]|uniref:5'-methylthioadenosine/S-adenosylhomocysteine nucleosidase n=1 Tax=Stratiformator vulcanicus TaxID=2527980 RepID=A0A517QXA7_9PLAN|nr:hypothetical protein [Stratiformator vulcanicus]QDT36218.1 5'-methylthioadenosine/S-adenosylhomocysteine nucleosidase [Stratiformator vulcanicus]
MTDHLSESSNRREAVAIVAALALELGPIRRLCQIESKTTTRDFTFETGTLGDTPIVLACSGPGREKARRATQAVLDAHPIGCVVSCGLAGALADELPLGAIVVADGVIDTEGGRIDLSPVVAPDIERRLFVGKLLTSGRVITRVDEKRRLGEETGALAVDMETFGTAACCRDAGVPCVAIRAISDDLSRDLPPDVAKMLTQRGPRQWGAAAGALLKEPSLATDLWTLREQATSAADILGRFTAAAVPQLLN